MRILLLLFIAFPAVGMQRFSYDGKVYEVEKEEFKRALFQAQQAVRKMHNQLTRTDRSYDLCLLLRKYERENKNK